MTAAGWREDKATNLRDSILRLFPANPAFTPRPKGAIAQQSVRKGEAGWRPAKPSTPYWGNPIWSFVLNLCMSTCPQPRPLPPLPNRPSRLWSRRESSPPPANCLVVVSDIFTRKSWSGRLVGQGPGSYHRQTRGLANQGHTESRAASAHQRKRSPARYAFDSYHCSSQHTTPYFRRMRSALHRERRAMIRSASLTRASAVSKASIC